MRFLILSLLLISAASRAQDVPADSTLGALAGVVTDADTGEPLVGANIFLPEIQRGAATDINGHYTIKGISEGTYRVVVRFAGLRPDSSDVQIRVGQTLRLDIQLAEDPNICGIIFCHCWHLEPVQRDIYTRRLIVYRNYDPNSCGCTCWTHERDVFPFGR